MDVVGTDSVYRCDHKSRESVQANTTCAAALAKPCGSEAAVNRPLDTMRSQLEGAATCSSLRHLPGLDQDEVLTVRRCCMSALLRICSSQEQRLISLAPCQQQQSHALPVW